MTAEYKPDGLRLWADWYEDKTDAAPPYQWGDDPGHAELLRDHATAIEAIASAQVERESLEQDLAVLHELFRKVTGYTAIEYIMMRESVKEGA